MNLDGAAGRIDNPVFLYAVLFVKLLFLYPVAFGRAWRKDLDDQIRRTVNAILFDDVRIADDHRVWDYTVIVVEMDVHTI